MSNETRAYKVEFKYKNRLHLIDTIIYLFSKTVLELEEELTKQEIDILKVYLIHGYSPEVKKGILVDLKMNAPTLNTNNCKLQKKGFLRPHPTSGRLKLVTEDLIKLRDCFINEGEKNLFLVHFVKG